jgi:MYXO-CTERM domain-containing protein
MRRVLAACGVATWLLLGTAAVAHAETVRFAQTDTTLTQDNTVDTSNVRADNDNDKKDNSGKIGLLGLIGLAGLAGLARRPDRDDAQRVTVARTGTTGSDVGARSTVRDDNPR